MAVRSIFQSTRQLANSVRAGLARPEFPAQTKGSFSRSFATAQATPLAASSTPAQSPPLWRRIVRKPFRKLFLLLAGSGTAWFAYSAATDDTFTTRMNRLWRIYSLFLPSLAEYKYNTLYALNGKTEEEKTAKYLELDKKWAPQYLERILELRGVWVKIGQVVLTRPDLLESEEYRRVLAPLLDTIPQRPAEEMEAIICRSLKINSLDEVFDSFDPIALGTASIAQVHAAKLKTGEDVVIKVRMPDTGPAFALDLKTMRALVRMAQPEMLPAQKEIENMIAGELDFRNEARSMKEIGDGIRASGRFPNVVVPVPFLEYSTDEVVTMTRLRGDKLYSRVLEHYKTFAKGMGMTLDELKTEMTAQYEAGERNPPTLWTFISQPRLVWASIKTFWHELVGWWLPTFLVNVTRTVTFQPVEQYPPPPLPTNHRALFETVARVHGFQVMSLGQFNGDAHAGNIFLLDDGKIGLLDFGATRKLSGEERLNLASNIELLCEPVIDVHKVAERTKALGFVSEKGLDYVGFREKLWRSGC